MPIPSIVQQVTGNPGNVTNFATSAVSTTAGTILLLIIGRGSGTTGNVTAVTDPAGNTWAVATRGGQGGSANTHCEVWYTKQNVAKLTAQTISVTTSAANLTVYNMVEVRDLNHVTLVEASSPDPSGAAASSTHSTPPVSAALPADWILSVICHAFNASADTFTSSGGVQLTSVVSGVDFRMSAGYYPTTATGTFDGDWTLPASTAAGLITIAFNQRQPFTVAVDWNKDGDYNDTGENVTDRVRRQAGLSFEYGRDQSTALAPTVAGRGQFTLNNSDKRFSPRYASSPLFGLVKPARPVKVTRAVGAIEYILFVGHTDDTPINPDLVSKSVNFSLVDALADFRGLNISTALHAGIRTGEAIDIILDEVGWTAGRDLDNGSTVMPYWWEDNTDAFTAMETLVRCEGPPALLTMGADGSLIFKDRHHRLVDAASITSQGTWRATTTEPIMNVPFVYDDAWRNIINHGLVAVDVRQLGEVQPIWTGDSYIKWSASETKTFIITTSDPFQDAVVPVSGTDYSVDAGAFSSVTLSRTSGASTTLTMTATGAGARIRELQLRGRPIEVRYTQQITASDATSIAAYGQRSYPGELEFCNIYDVQAILETAIAMRKDPLPILNIRFQIGNSTTRAAAILPRDLSDRVTVIEPETAVNDDVYIESFVHTISSEYDHEVIIGCEMVPPAGTVTAANVFIVGTGGAHDIGDGILAS